MSELTVQEQVIVRALKDAAFRQELLSNPRAVLARDYHVHVPENVSIRVLEDAPNTLTLVLPVPEAAMQELSDADLETAIGGVAGWDPRSIECSTDRRSKLIDTL